MRKKYTIEQLNHGRKVWNFMNLNGLAFIISSLLIIISLIIMSTKGFNWGLDFTGGTVIEISLEKPINMDHMREILQKTVFKDLLLQNFGSSLDIIIRIPPLNNINGDQKLVTKIIHVINGISSQHAIVKRIEFVGPNVGSDLVETSGIALLLAIISILAYVGFRFELRLATGVIIALIHDLIITMGLLSLFSIEVDLTTMASLMSVIGYSLNDSIVVSDRIRENFYKMDIGTPYEIFNVSLTQILHRTLISSSVILIVIMILYLFGSPILENFSLTMLIGVPIGTVSSIYVASALALKLGTKREHLLPKKATKEEEDQPYTYLN